MHGLQVKMVTPTKMNKAMSPKPALANGNTSDMTNLLKVTFMVNWKLEKKKSNSLKKESITAMGSSSS